MAIPFILGLAIGSATVITWNRFKTKKSAQHKHNKSTNEDKVDNIDKQTLEPEKVNINSKKDIPTDPSSTKKKA